MQIFYFFFLNQRLLVKLFFMSELPVLSPLLPSVLLVNIFLRHTQGFLFLSLLSGFLNVFLQALLLPFAPARAVCLHWDWVSE